MKSTDKIRDLTLKNAIIIVTYIALLVLGLKYFGNIMNFLGKLVSIIQPFIIGFILAFVFNIPMKFFSRKLPDSLGKWKRSFRPGDYPKYLQNASGGIPLYGEADCEKVCAGLLWRGSGGIRYLLHRYFPKE